MGPRAPKPTAPEMADEAKPTTRPGARAEGAAPSAAGDTPGDALNAFLAAARKPPSGPAPDPQVSVAFALGWQMAEMYRPEQREAREQAQPDDLPGIGALDAAQLTELGLHQVEAALARLKEPVKRAGQDLSHLESITRELHAAQEDAQRRDLILQLHIQLLSTLTAADFRLGKAYGLGRALADTCRNPATIEELQREFNPDRIATLRGWISDLSSAFPPHAGHSARESLDRWSERLATEPGTAATHLDDVLARLRRQGALWRALLSGEKLGRDMLELSNYVRAAESLVVHVRELAFGFIARFRLMLALTALLFAGGVALMLALQSSASVAAGLGGIVASLGLTWKGVGGSLGRAVAKVEQSVWEAQLDVAIADAITLIPAELLPPPPPPPRRRVRLKRFVLGGAPADAPPPQP